MLRVHSDQICAPSGASLVPLTEGELAQQLRCSGVRVTSHLGRYWRQARPGFYVPVHLLARLKAKEANKPAICYLGFKTSLSDEDKAAANCTIAVNVLPNLRSYDANCLSSNRRYQLRRCNKEVDIVMKDASLLQDQGYEIYVSARQRTGFGKALSRREYDDSLQAIFGAKRIVLGGMVANRLGGYLTAYAVGEVAYIQSVVLASEALKTHIGTGLTFEFVQICRRSSQVQHLVHGTPARDDTLTRYKESMGFSVMQVPALLRMTPAVDKALRWLAPHRYQRLWLP